MYLWLREIKIRRAQGRKIAQTMRKEMLYLGLTSDVELPGEVSAR